MADMLDASIRISIDLLLLLNICDTRWEEKKKKESKKVLFLSLPAGILELVPVKLDFSKLSIVFKPYARVVGKKRICIHRLKGKSS